MVAKNLAGLKNKAIAAFAIISVIALLYIFTSKEVSDVVEPKKQVLDTSKCETAAFTADDVKVHNKCSLRDAESNDFWIIVDGYVFDVTTWITQHPGGEAMCTVDHTTSSTYFHRAHIDWENIFNQLLKPKYCIGKYAHGA
jgi:cytochrome b involved in lipid metabolism